MTRLLATTAIVTFGLLAAPASFGQSNPHNTAGRAAAGTAAEDTLSQADKTFIKEAAIGGMAEVELSRVAQKSDNADVKAFANRMVQDHTAANSQLKGIVADLGAQMPNALDAQHKRMLEKLQTLHGKAFNDQYIHYMVEDHNKAVKLFQQEQQTGHNAELKQFAQKTLPTLQEHQKMAVELSHKLAKTAAK